MTDAIPQGRLARPVIPVLELASDVEHYDVQPLGTEQMQPDDFSAAAVPVQNSVEHVDVHDDLATVEFVSAENTSPLPDHNIP